MLKNAQLLCTFKDVVAVGGPEAIEVQSYPSGEPLITFRTHYDLKRLLVRPNSMSDFMAAMFYVDALAARCREIPDLILPRVPGDRQDRLNDEGDYLFTAKSVARMVNARRFPSVTLVDPHSDVISALIERSRVVYADHTSLNRQAYLGVIAPDAGAEKRASRVARRMGLPLVRAWKTRDVATGVISGFGVEPVQIGHYLVVDDLCDGGGTFIGLAEVLRKSGATADLFVTHGLFTKGTQVVCDAFTRVYCTDSTTGEKPGVHIIPTCEDLLRNF